MRTYEQIMAALPPARRAKIEAGARKLIAAERRKRPKARRKRNLSGAGPNAFTA
jgi:hypothetical protein